MESTGTPAATPPLRPEIASAWRRAELCGLDPGRTPGESDLAEVDGDSPLLAAARPVLDRAVARLSDTRFSLLLADRESRIVDRRFGHPTLAKALDDVLAVPGNRYSEDNCGTNALSTAFEIRRGIAVHGEEHFFERLKGFTCYGSPIVHPVTGRLEGVLDVTGFARDATPVLQTFATLVVAGIEERLLLGHGRTHQRMLAAFQERTARTRNPVLVFGEDLTLANDVATERFDGAAQVVLRELGRRAGQRGSGRAVLPSGQEVDFVCEPVAGTRQAHVVEVVTEPHPEPAAVPRTAGRVRTDVVDVDLLDLIRAQRRPVLVTGEPGTGRSHVLARLAEQPEPTCVDGSGPAPDRLLADLLAGGLDGGGLVVVDNVHLLTDVASHRVSELLAEHPGVWFALTCGPESDLTVEQRALTARCPERIALPPLRSRRTEVPSLATTILRRIAPGTRLAADTAKALIGWHWPGNLRELHTVLAAAAARCAHGVVTAADLALPQTSRPLTPLEQAEFDTIRAALRRHHGNKSHVATELGIGRTTLYRRLREFGL